SLNLSRPVAVGGTTLAAGQYQVTWEGEGRNVQLKVLKGKNVVATAPAELQDLSTPRQVDQIVTEHKPDGTTSLTKIEMRGKKYSLAVGEGAAETASTSAK